MIDLSSYTEPFTQEKCIYADSTESAQVVFEKQWTISDLIAILEFTQLVIKAHYADDASGCREWRIMRDSSNCEFYIYIDSDVIEIYSECPKQLTMDLLRVA